MFGVLFALENVVLMTQELVLCAAGLVQKKKKKKERGRERKSAQEREQGKGMGPRLLPGCLFKAGCRILVCPRAGRLKKSPLNKRPGTEPKVCSEALPHADSKASFLPHLADCCSGRLSHNGGPRGAVSGTHSQPWRRRRKLVPIPPLFL